MTQYFEKNPTSKSQEREMKIKIRNQVYMFTTDNGVFSKRGLDFGTRTLLEHLDFSRLQGKVLDFGCGYGPIGITIAKETKADVHMVDINNRSLKLALKNARNNKVDVKIYESNLYENVDETFDFIVSNPPIRVGKETLYHVLFDAKDHLTHGGELWIVINKNQGAKSVLKDLQKVYKADVVAKNKGFYVIVARNN